MGLEPGRLRWHRFLTALATLLLDTRRRAVNARRRTGRGGQGGRTHRPQRQTKQDNERRRDKDGTDHRDQAPPTSAKSELPMRSHRDPVPLCRRRR